MKFKEKEIIHRGNFINYCVRNFIDKNNLLKKWEYVERCSKVEAVIIYAYDSEKVILIKQPRPALSKKCIEFPAGLIDLNEKPAEAALRELLEETGYEGDILSISPLVSATSGVTDEHFYFASVKIKGNKREQNLDESEEIEVLEIPHKELVSFLSKEVNNGECVIDSKVWAKFML